MGQPIAKSTVSDRYQTVIPTEVRILLNLKKGDQVSFEKVGDQILIKKELSPEEKRQLWLKEALENYEAENLWGDLAGEDFHE